MKKAFQIKEIRPRIFLFEFNNKYDMCMYFLRYQEFYESASHKFRGKQFEIFDFMRWYATKYGKGVFTYPKDWDGFNLPSNIITDVWGLGLMDRNIYDYEMLRAWNSLNYKCNGESFYIIGAVNGSNAIGHEIAHGLFYLQPEYKREMTKLVKSLPDAIKTELRTHLKRLDYTPKVYVDEMQAYMATGLTEPFREPYRWATFERKSFEVLFKFSKKTK